MTTTEAFAAIEYALSLLERDGYAYRDAMQGVRALRATAMQGARDTARVDWLERETRAGRAFTLSWYKRQRSTHEEPFYDIPAGFYTDMESDPQPSLREAIDTAMQPGTSHE